MLLRDLAPHVYITNGYEVGRYNLKVVSPANEPRFCLFRTNSRFFGMVICGSGDKWAKHMSEVGTSWTKIS
jgi:hypothetical protein